MATSSSLSRSGGVWRGTTAEERVGPRRERLLEAGFKLLGDEGSENVTVRGVCTEAGLNARYFYESFDDLDALIGAVYDEIMDEARRLSLEAIVAAPGTSQAKTRAALEASIRYVTDDPRRIRIVFREGGDVLVRRRAKLISQAARLMADQAAAFYGTPRKDKLLLSSTYMLAGGLSTLLVAWQNGSLDLTVDELIDHASALVVGTGEAAVSIGKQATKKKTR